MKSSTIIESVSNFQFSEQANELLLEYLIIIHKNGLPIYSKCYTDICQILVKDNILISGFLSALATFPESLSINDKLSEVTMGKTKMIFSYSKQGDKIYIVGLPNNVYKETEHSHIIQGFFKSLDHLLKTSFAHYNWNRLSEGLFKFFEEELNKELIFPWFKVTDTHDNCPSGENCPFRIASHQSGTSNEETFWNKMSNIYSKLKYKLYN